MKCIEAGLRHYGVAAEEIVFWNFETKHKLSREDIPDHPKEFVQSLEEMFGIASRVIERVIIQEIKTSTELFDLDSFDLVAVMNRVKKNRIMKERG